MDLPRPFCLVITPEELVASYAAGQRFFQWADLRGAALAGAVLRELDFCDATLAGADLSGADLSGAQLQGADLSGADLTHAKLCDANLRWTDLSQAKLCNANLSRANLNGANLDGADLSSASLEGTTITGVSFENAEVVGVRLGDTRFINARLGSLCSSACRHFAPSSIDLQTMLRSRADSGLESFVRRAGIVGALAARMAFVARNSTEAERKASAQHVYLIHHRNDEALANKLHDALEQRNLTSYVAPWFPSSLSGCHAHRIVLLCSEAALKARTPLRGLWMMRAGQIPPFSVIALDEYLGMAVGRLSVEGRASEEAALWAALRSRVVAKLSRATSPEAFDVEVEKLMQSLKTSLDR